MRKAILFLTVICTGFGLAGCTKEASTDDLLVVNFEQNKPLRYQMTSERKTLIDLTGEGGTRQSKPQTMNERMDLVMVYTPVEVDPFGLTTLKVTCESAKVTRTAFSGKQAGADAVESLPGMSFTLTLTPTGQMEDLADFRRVVRQLGDKAFAKTQESAGRVKNPDMISDFITLQWSLWDSIASMKDPAEGLVAGKTWQTRQLMPWPTPLPNPPTRITTFSVDGIVEDDQQRKATLKSAYVLTEDLIMDIPVAYEGSFQMRGLFGFLRGYKFNSIAGGGTQVFNVDTGVLESDRQQYTLDVTADFMLPLGDSKPVLKIDQTISVELLK